MTDRLAKLGARQRLVAAFWLCNAVLLTVLGGFALRGFVGS